MTVLRILLYRGAVLRELGLAGGHQEDYVNEVHQNYLQPHVRRGAVTMVQEQLNHLDSHPNGPGHGVCWGDFRCSILD